MTACVLPRAAPPRPPASKYLPPVVQGERLVVEDAGAHYPPLVLLGLWQLDGSGRMCADNDVAIVIAGGRIPLREAHLCVTMSPFSLEGEARVPFPAVGALANLGLDVQPPRARLHVALGKELGSLALGKERMAVHPEHYYIIIDAAAGWQVALGRASLTTPGGGATLVIDPQEPMFYVAANLGGMMPGAPIEEAALGFSAAGRLPLTPRNKLFDGRAFRPMRVEGHLYLQGTVPIAGYPVSISGRFLFDIDANRDGRSVFDGDARDLVLAADGTLSLGYDRAGFQLSMEVAAASVVYDARPGPVGAVYFASATADKIFAGTPLAMLEPARGHIESYGYFRDPSDFAIMARLDARLHGFPIGGAEVALDTRGARVRGRLSLSGIGEVEVAGAIRPDGGFELTGRGNVTVGGFRMADAAVTLTPTGVRLAGAVSLPGLGMADVSGHVDVRGAFALRGIADLHPAGLRLAGARVSITPGGADVAGSIGFAGTGIAVTGTARPTGQFSLQGSVGVNTGIVRGRVELSVGDRGARAAVYGKACMGPACVDLPGLDIDTRGQVCPTFPLVGRRCVRVFG